MKAKELKELIKKYLTQTLKKDEKQKLDAWVSKSESNKDQFKKLTDANALFEEMKKLYCSDKKSAWRNLIRRLPIEVSKK